MKLFTAIYHDVQLLGHFLAHYRRAGVTDFFIAADTLFEHAVIEFASEYNMTVVSYLDVADTVIGGVSAVTEMRRRHQHDTEWVIIVDLDEFVEFLSTIEQVIACAERESANVVDAIMGDRFSLDGRVRGFEPDDDLPRIYPMRARFIRDVMCGCDIKGVLVKGLLASNVAHHTFRGEIICSKVLNISHYKWTEGSIDRLRTAYRMAVAAGLPWGRRVRQDPEVLPPAWPICMAGVRRGTDCCHSVGSAPMASSREGIIVLGFLIREPTGGQAWHYLNYVHGLTELGHDVYYIEDSGDAAMRFTPDLMRVTTDPGHGLQFARAAFERLGLSDRWAYDDAPSAQWMGARAADAPGLCKTADLVLQVSGVNMLRSWLEKVPSRIMIDTDPGFTQLRNLTDPGFRGLGEAHTAFFTFGANIGKPDCAIPDDGFTWRATRQPVSLGAWPYWPGSPSARLTTVMQWRSFPQPLRYGALILGMKSDSFRSFIDLPRRLGPVFQIAVRGPAEESPHHMLRGAGWGSADIDEISRDPWTYQAFLQQSKAEFGIAKARYVATRCGWFSERRANYLASGRPVLHQDTKFADWLPCGCGVFSFGSSEDVVEAISVVGADYGAQCRAARELAVEYFSAQAVLAPLLEAAFAGAQPPPEPDLPKGNGSEVRRHGEFDGVAW